jgi:Transposase and inactivated derivatives
MRKTPLVCDEYYHVYNRGVDKRIVFQDSLDIGRFLQGIQEFNTIEPIGSIFENSFSKDKSIDDKLVEIVCYCLNPNHFHLLLKQVSENGISEFMKRLSGGYTLYFNNRNKRTGALFQGKFKSSHIDSNTYLLHVSAYINLNNHLRNRTPSNSKSSWEEYVGTGVSRVCKTEIILDQYKNRGEYKKFAMSSLEDIIRRKELERNLEF